jgi:methionyl-tRNA synthetase
VVKKYGTDATRYLFLRHVQPFEDTGVPEERLDEWYTAHLTNGLGNVVARVMKMAEDNLSEPAVRARVRTEPVLEEWLGKFMFSDAIDFVWTAIQSIDLDITNKKPFQLIKESPTQGKELLINLVNRLQVVAYHLQPFMPATSEKIITAIKKNKKPRESFPQIMNVRYIDAHCHLQFDAYDANRDVIIENMRERASRELLWVVTMDHRKKRLSLQKNISISMHQSVNIRIIQIILMRKKCAHC